MYCLLSISAYITDDILHATMSFILNRHKRLENLYILLFSFCSVFFPFFYNDSNDATDLFP